MKETGPFVVFSLDFELRWGVADRYGTDLSGYRRNIEGVVDAVPALLDLFRKRGVRATWATVGAVACESWDEYESRGPALPRYDNPRLTLDLVTIRKGDPKGRLHFAPELVRLVAAAEGQELGSHTFSHIYMCERGIQRGDVDADARAVRALFEERFGVAPKSFVFPRNQVGFVDVLRERGIEVVRDNPATWYWDTASPRAHSRAARALRMADALLPLGKRSFHAGGAAHRASQFVRFDLPEPAFRLHRRRIADDAARMRPGDALHLWFHPHNLGKNPGHCLERLGSILDAIEDRTSVRYRSMGELSAAA